MRGCILGRRRGHGARRREDVEKRTIRCSCSSVDEKPYSLKQNASFPEGIQSHRQAEKPWEPIPLSLSHSHTQRAQKKAGQVQQHNERRRAAHTHTKRKE